MGIASKLKSEDEYHVNMQGLSWQAVDLTDEARGGKLQSTCTLRRIDLVPRRNKKQILIPGSASLILPRITARLS